MCSTPFFSILVTRESSLGHGLNGGGCAGGGNKDRVTARRWSQIMDSFLFSKIQVGETNDSGIPATATCPNLSPPPP